MEFQDFVSADDNLPTMEQLTDEAILQSIAEEGETKTAEDDEEVDEDPEPVTTITSAADALRMFKDLRNYIEQKDNVPLALFNTCGSLEDFLMNDAFTVKKQKKMTDFFSVN